MGVTSSPCPCCEKVASHAVRSLLQGHWQEAPGSQCCSQSLSLWESGQLSACKGLAGVCVCVCIQAPLYSLSVCPGLRDLVATQLSMGRLNGCCTLVRMIL